MLPNHPALYRVGVDDASSLPPLDYAAASLASWDDILEGLSAAVTSAAASAGCPRATASRHTAAAAATAASKKKRAGELAAMQRGVMHFMNQPHPLTMLSDYQAYGPQGCISRFHNPGAWALHVR